MNFPTEKLAAFAQKYGIPDYVRAAGTHIFEQLDDPRTKAAVYLAKFAAAQEPGGDMVKISSGNYIRCKGGTGPASRQWFAEIEKRAEILNISDDIEQLDKNLLDFALNSREKVTEPAEKYPLRSPDELKVAAWWLAKNANALNLPERRDLAGRILEKAAEYSISLPEEIEKYAGQGVADLEVLSDNLIKRAELVKISRLHTPAKRRKTAQHLEDLVQIISVTPNASSSPESLDKVAAVVQFVDNEYGLSKHYADGYLDAPDIAAYPLSTKTGAEIEKYAFQIGTDVYDIRDFERLKIADIINTLGNEYAEVMSSGLALDHEKIATVLEVMNNLELVLFRDMAKSAGISPQFQKVETIDLKELLNTL